MFDCSSLIVNINYIIIHKIPRIHPNARLLIMPRISLEYLSNVPISLSVYGTKLYLSPGTLGELKSFCEHTCDKPEIHVTNVF